MSTTTVNPIRTENSEPCSWVEVKMPEVETLDGAEWLRIGKILKRVAARDPETDLVDVMREVKNGDAQLWCLVDPENELVGAIVTRVLEFSTKYRSFLIHLAATEQGTNIELECWREVMDHLEGVGRMLGCDSIRVIGRKGWGKVLTDYTESARIFEKRLQEVNS